MKKLNMIFATFALFAGASSMAYATQTIHQHLKDGSSFTLACHITACDPGNAEGVAPNTVSGSAPSQFTPNFVGISSTACIENDALTIQATNMGDNYTEIQCQGSDPTDGTVSFGSWDMTGYYNCTPSGEFSGKVTCTAQSMKKDGK